MRGGGGNRSFSSRGGPPGDRDYGGGGGGGGKFRGNSYRDRGSSGGRFNNQNRGVDRRFDNSFNKPGSSNRNRSRYDRRSSERFSHGHNDRPSRSDMRDDALSRKRPRHDGKGGSRRDFGSNLSDSNRHSRHYSNGNANRNNSSSRNNRRPSPPPKPSPRHGPNDKNSSHRPKEHAPVNKTLRKFGGKGAVREKAEVNSRIRRSKLVTSLRSNILRRRLVNRNRDAVRRAKLMRSSLKKRDVKRKVAEGDDTEKPDKIKTDENDTKSDAEIDTEKKKTTKKTTESCNELDLSKENESADATEADAVVEDEEMQVDKTSDAEDDESNNKGDDKEKRKKYFRLFCMHCRIEMASFKDYNNHIHSRSHKLILGRYGLKQKTRLARMRLTQRDAQRQLDKELKDTEKLTPQFCMLCRLNYRSPKEEHMKSDAHRKMKEFLMPYCDTCSMSFKSPMSYEIHRCSVEHLRRKANKGEESDVEESHEELQVDLDNFLIVDSVGDVNGGELSINEESDENTTDTKPSDVSRAEINVGNEHVKKIEVFYCELCRYYLPHLEDPEAALQKHCSTRNHLRSYLHYKENQTLKITAELIHRRDHKEKHSKTDSKSGESKSKRSDSVAKTDDEATDKVWEDTDKDCDQMEQSNLENNNEDEDDASIERYDRFKYSEKTEDAEVSENDAEKDVDSSKNETADQNGTETNN